MRKKFLFLPLSMILCAVIFHIPASTVLKNTPDTDVSRETSQQQTAPEKYSAVTENISPVSGTENFISNNNTPEPDKDNNKESVRYAALTFDDGPHPGTTDRLLDGLLERNIHATFFLVGEEAAAHPELVLRMQNEGHQIGNHTWSHKRLESLDQDEMIQEIGKTDAFLQSLLGTDSYWLRPPYGLIRQGSESFIQVPMIQWSVDPRDWESRDTDKVVQTVLEDVRPNSIILLHDIYPTSVEAALQLADILPARGYELVSVAELFQINHIVPLPGVMYRNAD